MPTGLTTAWGYPPGAVANQFQTMMSGDHPLTYEFGMSSYPPIFAADGQFQSPLTPIAAQNNNAMIMNFGRRRKHKKSGKKNVKGLKNDLKKLK
jgi:hypothetical protein